MEDSVRAPLQRRRALAWLDSPLRGACTKGVADVRPALCEYLFDGVVDVVGVRTAGWVGPHAGLWPINPFHLDCYDAVVGSFSGGAGDRHVGCSPPSRRGICSPRPLRALRCLPVRSSWGRHKPR